LLGIRTAAASSLALSGLPETAPPAGSDGLIVVGGVVGGVVGPVVGVGLADGVDWVGVGIGVVGFGLGAQVGDDVGLPLLAAFAVGLLPGCRPGVAPADCSPPPPVPFPEPEP
jgi:hypothetical protein